MQVFHNSTFSFDRNDNFKVNDKPRRKTIVNHGNDPQSTNHNPGKLYKSQKEVSSLKK